MSRLSFGVPRLDRRARRAASITIRRLLGGAAFLLATASSGAAAQGGSGTIAGVVVAEGTLTPIAEAQVLISGTTTGTTTDAGGRFRLVNLTGTDVSIEVRRLGYRPTTVSAPLRATALNARLTSEDLPYRRGEIRKIFWPASRSLVSRRSSASRFTNAAAGTTSP
jgi:hypothetical protein